MASGLYLYQLKEVEEAVALDTADTSRRLSLPVTLKTHLVLDRDSYNRNDPPLGTSSRQHPQYNKKGVQQLSKSNSDPSLKTLTNLVNSHGSDSDFEDTDPAELIKPENVSKSALVAKPHKSSFVGLNVSTQPTEEKNAILFKVGKKISLAGEDIKNSPRVRELSRRARNVAKTCQNNYSPSRDAFTSEDYKSAVMSALELSTTGGRKASSCHHRKRTVFESMASSRLTKATSHNAGSGRRWAMLKNTIKATDVFSKSKPNGRHRKRSASEEFEDEWSSVHDLESFVPDLVLEHIALSSLGDAPLQEVMDCTVILADISGFTPLTEGLSKKGSRGLEQLNETLNSYFGAMIDIIYEHGGDVIKFAGDALLAVWRNKNSRSLKKTYRSVASELGMTKDVNRRSSRVGIRKASLATGKSNWQDKIRKWREEEANRTASNQASNAIDESGDKFETPNSSKQSPKARQETLKELTLRAANCCLQLNKKLDGLHGLRLHIGFGSGSVVFMHVGGLMDRWELLMAGDALVQMSQAEGAAKPGEVCASQTAWELIKDDCIGEYDGIFPFSKVEELLIGLIDKDTGELPSYTVCKEKILENFGDRTLRAHKSVLQVRRLWVSTKHANKNDSSRNMAALELAGVTDKELEGVLQAERRHRLSTGQEMASADEIEEFVLSLADDSANLPSYQTVKHTISRNYDLSTFNEHKERITALLHSKSLAKSLVAGRISQKVAKKLHKRKHNYGFDVPDVMVCPLENLRCRLENGQLVPLRDHQLSSVVVFRATDKENVQVQRTIKYDYLSAKLLYVTATGKLLEIISVESRPDERPKNPNMDHSNISYAQLDDLRMRTPSGEECILNNVIKKEIRAMRDRAPFNHLVIKQCCLWYEPPANSNLSCCQIVIKKDAHDTHHKQPQIFTREHGCVRITKVKNPFVPTCSKLRSPEQFARPLPQRIGNPSLSPDIVEEDLARYVPGCIRDIFSEDGSSDSKIGTFRKATVLFINLTQRGKGINYNNPDVLKLCQDMLHCMQRELYRFEGSVRQYIMDDKGTTLIGVFGLPPFANKNQAQRALRCAMAIRKSLHKIGVLAAIGVTTGDVVAGSVGNQSRREYAVMGDIVNLSARLMCKATPDGPHYVLCDRRTHDESVDQIAFQALPPIKVKGKSDPIEIFVPQRFHAVRLTRSTGSGNKVAVGQLGQREAIAKAVKSCATNEGADVILLEGGNGMGKSLLLAETVLIARRNDLDARLLSVDPIQSYEPYRTAISFLLSLLSLDVTLTPSWEEFKERAYACGMHGLQDDCNLSAVLEIRESLVWQVENDGGEWIDFDAKSRKPLSEAYFSQKEDLVDIGEGFVDLKKMVSCSKKKRYNNRAVRAVDSEGNVQINQHRRSVRKSLNLDITDEEACRIILGLMQQKHDYSNDDEGKIVKILINMVVRISDNISPHTGLVICIDDAHSMDVQSWAVFVQLTRYVLSGRWRTLLLFSIRPIGESDDDYLEETCFSQVRAKLLAIDLPQNLKTVKTPSRPSLPTGVQEVLKKVELISLDPMAEQSIYKMLENRLQFKMHRIKRVTKKPIHLSGEVVVNHLEVQEKKIVTSEHVKQVMSRIYESSQGNPLYALQLIKRLLGQGTIQIIAGQCKVPDIDVFWKIKVPSTLQSLLSTKIDKQRPANQTILKVSSVFFAQGFSQRQLESLLKVHNKSRFLDSKQTRFCLDSLVEDNLFVATSAETSPGSSSFHHMTYRFKNSLVRQAAYDMLLFAQRRPLHKAIVDDILQKNADIVQNLIDSLSLMMKPFCFKNSWRKTSLNIAKLCNQLAMHEAGAGNFANAFKYYQKAMRSTSSLLDFHQSLKLGRSALELMDRFTIQHNHFALKMWFQAHVASASLHLGDLVLAQLLSYEVLANILPKNVMNVETIQILQSGLKAVDRILQPNLQGSKHFVKTSSNDERDSQKLNLQIEARLLSCLTLHSVYKLRGSVVLSSYDVVRSQNSNVHSNTSDILKQIAMVHPKQGRGSLDDAVGQLVSALPLAKHLGGIYLFVVLMDMQDILHIQGFDRLARGCLQFAQIAVSKTTHPRIETMLALNETDRHVRSGRLEEGLLCVTSAIIISKNGYLSDLYRRSNNISALIHWHKGFILKAMMHTEQSIIIPSTMLQTASTNQFRLEARCFRALFFLYLHSRHSIDDCLERLEVELLQDRFLDCAVVATARSLGFFLRKSISWPDLRQVIRMFEDDTIPLRHVSFCGFVFLARTLMMFFRQQGYFQIFHKLADNSRKKILQTSLLRWFDVRVGAQCVAAPPRQTSRRMSNRRPSNYGSEVRKDAINMFERLLKYFHEFQRTNAYARATYKNIRAQYLFLSKKFRLARERLRVALQACNSMVKTRSQHPVALGIQYDMAQIEFASKRGKGQSLSQYLLSLKSLANRFRKAGATRIAQHINETISRLTPDKK